MIANMIREYTEKVFLKYNLSYELNPNKSLGDAILELAEQIEQFGYDKALKDTKMKAE